MTAKEKAKALYNKSNRIEAKKEIEKL